MTHGHAPRVPMTALPGVRESVRLLVESEQYSLTDVALMFGVSRERVRQLCGKWAITYPQGAPSGRGIRAVRIWDDDRHRFLPVPKRTIRREAATRKRVTLAMDRFMARQARRAEMTGAIRAAYVAAGRPLTVPEMCAACGLPPNAGTFTSAWDGRQKNRAGILAEIHAVVGMPSRSRGAPGHLMPRKWRTRADRCRRGHPLTDAYAYASWAGRLQCRTCIRERREKQRNGHV